jgi:hypothetical protein
MSSPVRLLSRNGSTKDAVSGSPRHQLLSLKEEDYFGYKSLINLKMDENNRRFP